MWVSRARWERLVKRIEDLEKQVGIAVYGETVVPSMFISSEYNIPINKILTMLMHDKRYVRGSCTEAKIEDASQPKEQP